MNYEGYEVKEGSKIENIDRLIMEIGICRRYQEIDYADRSFEEYCEDRYVGDLYKTQEHYNEDCKEREEKRDSLQVEEADLKEELRQAMGDIPLDELKKFLTARVATYKKDCDKYQAEGSVMERDDARYQVNATITAQLIVKGIENKTENERRK